MEQILSVETKNYDIIISDNNLLSLMNKLSEFTVGQQRLFIVSEKVFKLYKKELEIFSSEIFVLKDGEKEKNYKNYLKIVDFAQKRGLTRKDAIVAIGGGVVGDLAGLVASTYMRGIDYIQVPTTLLAMVDSSVGGKTAIDVGGIKNLIGSFYQPKKVYINLNFLKTLDKRQFLSGLGEVLKYALIEDSCEIEQPNYLFEYLTLSCKRILEKDSLTIMRMIEYCLLLKISVVNKDEKEANLRKILNLGHTLGHALEALSGYKKILHGEAVIQGIYFIFDYAKKNKLITDAYYCLVMDLLSKYGFRKSSYRYKAVQILEKMKNDKKALDGEVTFIIPCDKKKVKEIKLQYDEVLKLL